jgi:tetratricopeptide (TPR) repeat protein
VSGKQLCYPPSPRSAFILKKRAAIIVPVAAAAACTAVLLGFLWWQLKGAGAIGKRDDHREDAKQDSSAQTILPVETGDESLVRLRKGDVLALQGDWAAAAKEYAASVDAGGGLSALRKLAQAQLQRRDIDGARDTLKALRRAGARSEDLLLLEAIILLRTGEVTKARELLTEAAESPQKRYGLALLAIIEARHDDAKAELAAVNAGWEPVLRANAKTLLSAYEEFNAFPGSPDSHLTALLGRVLAQVQECELALPLLSQVTRLEDEYRDAWMVQGYCELTTERLAEAQASFERAYAIDPEKPEIQYFLARAYAARGDHGNALTFAQYAQQNGFEPKAEAMRLIAREALQSGNIPLALDQYDALTQLPEATLDSYVEFAAAAIGEGNKEDAYVKAIAATGKWPTDARAFDLLGWTAIETNRTDEAAAALDKALELDPRLKSAQERKRSLQ